MSNNDAVIAIIEREGCIGCVDEGTRLQQCCIAFVDTVSACVICENYRHTEKKP